MGLTGAAVGLGVSAIGAGLDQYNSSNKIKKMRSRFDAYMAENDAMVNNQVNEARKALSTTTASQIAQVSQGAAARGSQSGVSGANTEAIITQASQPIYQNEQQGQQNILNFIASNAQERAKMIYGFNSGVDQIEFEQPGFLETTLGLLETGANIYSGGVNAGLWGGKDKTSTFVPPGSKNPLAKFGIEPPVGYFR